VETLLNVFSPIFRINTNINLATKNALVLSAYISSPFLNQKPLYQKVPLDHF